MIGIETTPQSPPPAVTSTSDRASPVPRSRLVGIDMLRGMAALAVVGAHAMNHGGSKTIQVPWYRVLYWVIHLGHLGVPLFFVLSGFCIHLRWAMNRARTGSEELSFSAFWRRRVRRLYPPYLVIICVSIAAVLIAYSRGMQIETVTRYPEPKLQWIGLDFFSHALMLHGLHPLFDGSGGNQPLWTLAREEYFYLAYLPLLALRRKLGLPAAVLIPALLSMLGPPAAAWLLHRFVADPEQFRLLNHPFNAENSALALWVQWCLGMAAAEAYCGLVKLPAWTRSAGPALLWTAGALATEQLGWPWLSIPLWGLVFFTVVNVVVQREAGSEWKLSPLQAWLSGVGVFSYSVYLVHSPLLGLCNQIEIVVARRLHLSLDNPFGLLVGWALMVTVVYWAARLFFQVVERRFLNTPPRFPMTAEPGP